MKQLSFAVPILVAFVFAFSANAEENNQHLFILSGQSNMARLDPNISFTPAVENAFGKENVTVVKDAQGGKPIRRWYKDWKPANGEELEAKGELYDRLMKKVHAASQGKQFATVTLVWMQGERDAREEYGAVYAASLLGLLDQFGNDLNRKDINFVVGRLSDHDMGNAQSPHWTMVREAQMEVASSSPRVDWVDTDDFNDGFDREGNLIKNDLHGSVRGYKILGKRFAEKSIELINNNAQPADDVYIEVEDLIAEDLSIVRLWPIDQIGGEQNRLSHEVTNRGKIRFENVKDPHLVVYQVERSKPTPAVIYCPGGAYKHLTPKLPIIQWFNDNGVTVFLLKYTVPNDREAAFADVQRAMRLVRFNAKKLNLDPDQIGVLGSSAGGHLVARLSQNYEPRAYQSIDEADAESCEPRFVILTSAAYFFKSTSKEKEKVKEPVLADEFPMESQTAPTFMVYAKDDKTHFDGGIAYGRALNAAGGKVRIMVSATGGHELNDVDWYPQCRQWLEGLGIELE